MTLHQRKYVSNWYWWLSINYFLLLFILIKYLRDFATGLLRLGMKKRLNHSIRLFYYKSHLTTTQQIPVPTFYRNLLSIVSKQICYSNFLKKNYYRNFLKKKIGYRNVLKKFFIEIFCTKICYWESL